MPVAPLPRAAALLMADARLPSGAHVHSGGIEEAIDARLVHDIATLEDYLEGRLMTAGVLAAHAAAYACRISSSVSPSPASLWCELDAEMSARMLAPSVRATSRRQGRSLLRTGTAVFGPVLLIPCDHSLHDGPHLAAVQGTVAAAAGLGAEDAALVAAYGIVMGPAAAALRLLGLDPVALASMEARLAPHVDCVARHAASTVQGPAALPAPSAPMADALAEHHAARKERLFAS